MKTFRREEELKKCPTIQNTAPLARNAQHDRSQMAAIPLQSLGSTHGGWGKPYASSPQSTRNTLFF
uniref:Uncharacterized protein n=1 Tax=Arundo donax TaxID=35708 RepID=A0A0A8Y3T8_ARUDO